MTERPILMCAEMVRQTLAGVKTQTRRVIKPQPQVPAGRIAYVTQDGYLSQCSPSEIEDPNMRGRVSGIPPKYCSFRSPYGVRGDRLWVRETFWRDVREPKTCVIYAENPNIFKYSNQREVKDTRSLRDGFAHVSTTEQLEKHEFWKRIPSIFMPRWASRITLEITDVRVERLQDITEADARAEGFVERNQGPLMQRCGLPDGDELHDTCRNAFASIWERLNKARGFGWESNPWVWAISFKRVETSPCR